MARRRSLGTLFAILVVAGTLGMWGYLFFIADPGVPDRLEDEAFPTTGQAICAEATSRIEALPAAREAETPEERGAVVAEANEILEHMVDELAAVAPTEGDDARIVGLWLQDWEVLLADRAAYADQLLAGEDAELLVSAREEGGGQITVTLDHFAQINDMEDCQAPLDA